MAPLNPVDPHYSAAMRAGLSVSLCFDCILEIFFLFCGGSRQIGQASIFSRKLEFTASLSPSGITKIP